MIIVQFRVGNFRHMTLLMIQQCAFQAFNQPILGTQIDATANETCQIGEIVQMMTHLIVVAIVIANGCNVIVIVVGNRNDNRYLLWLAIAIGG